MSEQQLKPCPFCGSEDVGVTWVRDPAGVNRDLRAEAVRCNNGCYSQGPRLFYAPGRDLADKLTHRWNHRPIEDALRAEIAELHVIIQVANATIDRLATELKKRLGEA